MSEQIIAAAREFADTVEIGDQQRTTWAERQLEAQVHMIRLLTIIAENTTPKKPIEPVHEKASFEDHMYHCNTRRYPGTCKYGNTEYCPACATGAL